MALAQTLLRVTADYKITLTPQQVAQFELYCNLLAEWNEKINLTTITQPDEVALKHFADCLEFFNYIDVPQGASIIDVGTGAGFPGLVLKIARPDINLTLLDSLNKRLVFLQEVLDKISLTANIIHSRAEDGANKPQLRESFDFAVSRAVARLNVLSEYCLPYVKVGGSFVALKGPNAGDEVDDSKKALSVLGGRVKTVHSFDLADDCGSRNIVEISKIKSTPAKYPRNSGKIKSAPL